MCACVRACVRVCVCVCVRACVVTAVQSHRPFERTVTMQKDNLDHVGFVFKKAMITAIVKDSSAARLDLAS